MIVKKTIRLVDGSSHTFALSRYEFIVEGDWLTIIDHHTDGKSFEFPRTSIVEIYTEKVGD